MASIQLARRGRAVQSRRGWKDLSPSRRSNSAFQLTALMQ